MITGNDSWITRISLHDENKTTFVDETVVRVLKIWSVLSSYHLLIIYIIKINVML